jgi:hypothetical protein
MSRQRDPTAPLPAFASMLNALATRYGTEVAEFAEREFNDAARRLRVHSKEMMERRLTEMRAENERKWQAYKKQD